jgi:hypothetical protein
MQFELSEVGCLLCPQSPRLWLNKTVNGRCKLTYLIVRFTSKWSSTLRFDLPARGWDWEGPLEHLLARNSWSEITLAFDKGPQPRDSESLTVIAERSHHPESHTYVQPRAKADRDTPWCLAKRTHTTSIIM